ncbi:MAG TPA: hypothetical protein DDZ51_28770 [Planctomycetaceae bacterium]|nr:hypothetical protein [Planctomycetaceae bacterium]
MYFQFVAIMLLSIMIATGFLHRCTPCAFAIAMIHVFLLDRTNYQKHYF